MYGPKWPFLLIFIHMWTRCGWCEMLGQVAMLLGHVFWWNSPYKGDSARFSLNPESWRKGLNEVVLGYPTSMNIRRVDGLSTDPRETCKKNVIQRFGLYFSLYFF